MSLYDLSRAATMIRTLCTPRAAALLAHVPPRPGQSITQAELLAASGLPVEQAATTLARLCELGVVRRDGDTLALDREHLEALTDSLTAASPLRGLVERHPPLGPYVSDGRWTQDPAKPRLVEEMYAAFGELFEPGTELTEAEVTAFLADIHPDPASMRRGLVDRGLLVRDPGTREFRVPARPPVSEPLEET